MTSTRKMIWELVGRALAARNFEAARQLLARLREAPSEVQA